eukprot:gene14119-17869_t
MDDESLKWGGDPYWFCNLKIHPIPVDLEMVSKIERQTLKQILLHDYYHRRLLLLYATSLSLDLAVDRSAIRCPPGGGPLRICSQPFRRLLLVAHLSPAVRPSRTVPHGHPFHSLLSLGATRLAVPASSLRQP